ncbi:hypothetical protein JTB14_014935 [Gonioctena quinquepunctata]|nr:hypothetical protein JTB14_014935 [Gonioctena quinquepunctata]
MEQLTFKNIYGTGTIMANRINGPEFKKDRHMKRGESEEFVGSDKKLYLTKWMDNKSKLMLSNALRVESQSSVKRWDKIRRERVEVTCPKVVSTYNKKMGGVDLADQMIEYYRSFFKTKKWSFKVILHLFDLAVVNSWMEYKNDFEATKTNATKPNKIKIKDLHTFRLDLREYLISGSKKRPIAVNDINSEEN